jgi:16S rRNA A1518/A1519 N6-dimethyltransferase RsmA/KsgA/DIM1 with predicted DNA glycosylase/AP lyase activity
MKRSKIRNKKVLIMLGAGLGYQLKTLLKRKDPTARIFAVEKDRQVFNKLLESQEWRESELAADVEFIVGKDVDEVVERLHDALEHADEAEVDVVTNKPSFSLDPEYYRKIIKEQHLVVDDK